MVDLNVEDTILVGSDCRSGAAGVMVWTKNNRKPMNIVSQLLGM
jgi:hypothetical protein